MCDEASRLSSEAERDEWYDAASRGKRKLADLLLTWGITHSPWYADNTREPLRDETFRAWAQLGAVLRNEALPTTSSKPQWSLAPDFALLLDPELEGDELAERIDDWQDDHLGAIGRTRIALARQLAGPEEQVIVTLPGGSSRTLAPGGSSMILKGVIELFAPRLLARPAVLLISESRQHLDIIDAALLRELRIEADAARLLPDALLFDAGPGHFWFVEVVFTDGAIDEGRKNALAAWARSQGVPDAHCRYLTAFLSRAAPPFRRLVWSLAWGSHVWFLDEPERVVRFESL